MIEHQRILELNESFCPHGFVIPDDMNGEGVFFVNRTFSDCAASCKFPMYTDVEWERSEMLSDVAVYMSVPLLALVICVYYFDVEKKNQYLVRAFAVLSMVHTIDTAYMQSIPFEERFCRNNAESLDASDGLTGCAVQAVIQVYISLSLALCWLLQAVDVFARVVLERRIVLIQPQTSWAIMLGLPLISVAVLLVTGSYAYSRGSLVCHFDYYVVMDNKVDLFTMFIPLAVICSVGMALMLAVLSKMGSVFGTYYRGHVQRTAPIHPDSSAEAARGVGYTTYSSTGTNPDSTPIDDSQVSVSSNSRNGSAAQAQVQQFRSMWDIMVFCSTPMLFLFLFLLIYVSMLAAGFRGGSRRNLYLRSFRAWGQCALDNYNGIDSSWHAVCGEHPKTRVPGLGREFFAFIFPGQGMLIALIFGRSVMTFLNNKLLKTCWIITAETSLSGDEAAAKAKPIITAEPVFGLNTPPTRLGNNTPPRRVFTAVPEGDEESKG